MTLISISADWKTDIKLIFRVEVVRRPCYLWRVRGTIDEMTQDDTEAGEELLSFFQSVFVDEGKGAVPTFERNRESTSVIDIGCFEITQEDVEKKLSNLRGKSFRTRWSAAWSSKRIGKLLRDKMPNHSSVNQHGFTGNRSYLINLLEILEEWTQALDEGVGCCCLTWLSGKAFDTMPYQRLRCNSKDVWWRWCWCIGFTTS